MWSPLRLQGWAQVGLEQLFITLWRNQSLNVNVRESCCHISVQTLDIFPKDIKLGYFEWELELLSKKRFSLKHESRISLSVVHRQIKMTWAPSGGFYIFSVHVSPGFKCLATLLLGTWLWDGTYGNKGEIPSYTCSWPCGRSVNFALIVQSRLLLWCDNKARNWSKRDQTDLNSTPQRL